MRNRTAQRRGFTLVEATVAMMIISTGVVAMCGLLGAGTAATVNGNELTTAVHLAGSLHEAATALPVDTNDADVIGHPRNIRALNGVTFSPAVDGTWQPMADMAGWSQQVVVKQADDINGADDAAATHLVRLSVTIVHQGHEVYTQSWLMTASEPAPVQ